MTHPQGDGVDRAYPPVTVHCGAFVRVERTEIDRLIADTKRLTLTRTGDLFRAIHREVLRDVLPAYSRLTAEAGVTVEAIDWTHGRVRFTEKKDRDNAWRQLFGLAATAIANAESIDARMHWRLCSSFIHYLALLEYQNCVTALKHQEPLGLSPDQSKAALSDAHVFGTYAGVL